MAHNAEQQSEISESTNEVTSELYPLQFTPIFQRYLWGGTRLAEILQKPIGCQSAAESWEIVDHQAHQSVVAQGPLAGTTLRELLDADGAALVGASVMQAITSVDQPLHLRGRFPLLLKYLDACQDLSVQVHPDDRFGRTLDPPDLGKTEAWYVMHADPGARIYAGLKSGVTEAMFREAVACGRAAETLHSFHARTGDCVFVPAGTMHAIGAGLLIAEIQQASNTTFRVDDWGRVDQNGNPRPLHLEQAIEVTNFERGPVQPVRSGNDSFSIQTLVACEKFVLQRVPLVQSRTLGGDGQFHIIAGVQGSAVWVDSFGKHALPKGGTVLLPASMPPVEFAPTAEATVLIEIHVPS